MGQQVMIGSSLKILVFCLLPLSDTCVPRSSVRDRRMSSSVASCNGRFWKRGGSHFLNHTLGRVDFKDSLLVEQIRFKAAFGEAVLGVMDRLVLSDAAWERMAPLIIGRPDQKGSTGRDNRMFVEGVLWIVRTGSPWRDLPEAFGDWNSVFRRFSRWSIKGVWRRIFEAMSDDPDFEYLIVDSTIVRAHQHAAGAKKGGLKIRRSAARAAA